MRSRQIKNEMPERLTAKAPRGEGGGQDVIKLGAFQTGGNMVLRATHQYHHSTGPGLPGSIH